MSWKFADWHIVWCLLELDDLLVDELTLLVYDKVRVQGTLSRSLARELLSCACSGQGQTSEAAVDWDVLCVLTVSALNMENSRL